MVKLLLQLRMGLVCQALMLAESVMTLVLTHGSLHEQGTFLLFKAKCKIYQSHQMGEKEDISSILGLEYNLCGSLTPLISLFAEILAKSRLYFERVQAVNKVKEVLLCMVT
jgi:hypothetical protein